MRIETPSDDPTTTPTDETDEVDADTEVLDANTGVDVIEYLGEYESVEAYLQSILADLVDPAIVWILNHLDYRAVLAMCEADGGRYFREGAAVYITRSLPLLMRPPSKGDTNDDGGKD